MKPHAQLDYENRIRRHAPATQSPSHRHFYIALLGWVNDGCPTKNRFGFTQENGIGSNSVLYFRHLGWRDPTELRDTVLPQQFEKCWRVTPYPFEGGYRTAHICDVFKYRNYARLAWISVYAEIPGDSTKEFLGEAPKYQHPVLHRFYNDLNAWTVNRDHEELSGLFTSNNGLCGALKRYVIHHGIVGYDRFLERLKRQFEKRHLDDRYPFNTGIAQYMSDQLYQNPRRLTWIQEYAKIPPTPPWYRRLLALWR